MPNDRNDHISITEPPDGTLHFSRGLLARNTFYNLLGYVLPLPVAVVIIPLLIEGMGTERFGVLSIAWIVIGYFGLLDMGIGRATTKFVAEDIARGEQRKLRELVLVSLALLSGFGLLGGLLLALLAGVITTGLLNIPENLLRETQNAFYLLAVSIPIVLLTAGVRGVLEAQQRFGVINAVKIPSSLATFIVPFLVLSFSNSLYPIVGMLVITRAVALIFYLYICWKGLPLAGGGISLKKHYFGRLLRFGGWLSVSNIIAPLLGNMDRFFIGSILTMTAVTWYVTPYDMINKLFIFPIGMLGVIFPAFSVYAAVSTESLIILHRRAVNYILIAMTPIVLMTIVLAGPFLHIWLGDEFALRSTLVLQILGAGVLFSSVARVPYNALQAMGRPDLTAKIFLIELPFYLAFLFILTKSFGIVGVAILWLVRLIIETIVMFVLFRRTIPASIQNSLPGDRNMYSWMITSVAVSWALSLLPNLTARIIILVVLLGLFAYLAFSRLLDSYDRARVRQFACRTLGLRIRSE